MVNKVEKLVLIIMLFVLFRVQLNGQQIDTTDNYDYQIILDNQHQKKESGFEGVLGPNLTNIKNIDSLIVEGKIRVMVNNIVLSPEENILCMRHKYEKDFTKIKFYPPPKALKKYGVKSMKGLLLFKTRRIIDLSCD